MNSTTRQRVTIGAGAAIAVGSLMPWGTVRSAFGEISMNGIEGDGVFTLLFGGLIVALAFRLDRRSNSGGVAVLAGLSGVVALLALSSIGGVAGSQYTQVAPGMGLYLTAIGSAVAFVMPLLHTDREQAAKEVQS